MENESAFDRHCTARTATVLATMSERNSQSVWLMTVAMLISVLCSIATAQSTTGSIYGQITDQSGALVVGASVIAHNQATGVDYPGRSDGQGNYAVFNLLPGVYSVRVEKDGFDSAAVREVRIVIDQKQLLNFQLKVGAIATVETVTSAPTMLQTESAETGEVIQSHDILDLPLLGRRFFDLTALTAGVSQQGGSLNTFNFSVNGQREYANSIQIDGIESTTNRTQDITATPSVDSIEEFKVATSNYDAEFGRSAARSRSRRSRAPTGGMAMPMSFSGPISRPPSNTVSSGLTSHLRCSSSIIMVARLEGRLEKIRRSSSCLTRVRSRVTRVTECFRRPR